ncbi:hypothetical protein M0Q50_02145 [bacterium]|jgi:hypothetical protein|nr:hypothetical protein [bacterium]
MKMFEEFHINKYEEIEKIIIKDLDKLEIMFNFVVYPNEIFYVYEYEIYYEILDGLFGMTLYINCKIEYETNKIEFVGVVPENHHKLEIVKKYFHRRIKRTAILDQQSEKEIIVNLIMFS